MKKSTRIAVEVLGPAFLGNLIVFVWRYEEFSAGPGIRPSVFFGYLGFAYAFALVPSAVYAWIMELWLRRSPERYYKPVLTVLLSTALGCGAGYLILLASEAPVVWIGGVVGFILGVVIASSPPPNEQRV